MIDLDQLESNLDYHALRAPFSAALVALIAEARASRKVIDAARELSRLQREGYIEASVDAEIELERVLMEFDSNNEALRSNG